MCESSSLLKLAALIVGFTTSALQSVAYAENLNPDGAHPRGVVAVSGTTIFGTAASGGAYGNGTVWSFDLASNQFSTLHNFQRGTSGASASGGVALLGTTLVGAAAVGGANDAGTLWSIDTNINSFSKLFDFDAVAHGSHPDVSKIASGTTIFGASDRGGPNDSGTLWSFDTSTNTFTKLHDFSYFVDGARPFARGMALSDLKILGTTRSGGARWEGTLWSFDTSSNAFTTLHDFDGHNEGGVVEGIVLSGATVFGTTLFGPAKNDGLGIIWSFERDTANFAIRHEFLEPGDAGVGPNDTLAMLGPTVFGTTFDGGTSLDRGGTLWSFDTSVDTFTKLRDFGATTDGMWPGGVTLSDTRLLGTAEYGGANDNGTIWSFDTATNAFTKLYEFSNFVVPEPATVTLAALSGLALLCIRKSRL